MIDPSSSEEDTDEEKAARIPRSHPKHLQNKKQPVHHHADSVDNSHKHHTPTHNEKYAEEPERISQHHIEPTRTSPDEKALSTR